MSQASQRDSKPGSDARAEAMKTITKVVAAGLHRIAQAMGQDSECLSKASKVSNDTCACFLPERFVVYHLAAC